MRRSRFWPADPPTRVLTPYQRALLEGWILWMDVDLDLAQRVLRLPPAQWPELPEPGQDAAAAAVPAPVSTRAPLGAYARRAAARKGAG